MKNKIGLLLVCLILMGCKAQKKIVSNENKCNVQIVPPSEDFESFYKTIDSTDFFKNELANFNNTNNGIFYYEHHDGIQNGGFFIVDIDSDYSVKSKNLMFNKNVNLSIEIKKKLNETLILLKDEDYFQSCSGDQGHMTVCLLIIKCNNEKVQYFSFTGFPSQIKIADDNFKLIQEVFDIMNYNSHKK